MITRDCDSTRVLRGYKNKNVVVLGASGFIGRWLARALSQIGANVFLFVRDKSAAEKIFKQYQVSGEIFEIDLIDDVDSLKDIFKTIAPNIVFNLAGYGVNPNQRDSDLAYKINADLVQSVCHAMATAKHNWCGQDIVHVGSALEYGKDTGNLSETTVCIPTTLYGKSKLLGTQQLTKYCEHYGLIGVTVRLFSVYGPGEHDSRLLPSLINAAKGQLLPLTEGRQERDFTYIDDVVEGLLRFGIVSKSDKFEKTAIVNLASGKLTSIRSFVEAAASILEINTKNLLFGKIPIRSEEMQHLPVTNLLLQQQIHWVPSVSIGEGVNRCAMFLRLFKQ